VNKSRFAQNPSSGLPAVLLTALVFPAIWLTWPVPDISKAAHRNHARSTRYVFGTMRTDSIRLPTQFVFPPFKNTGGIAREDASIHGIIASVRPDPARLLERTSPAVGLPPTRLLEDPSPGKDNPAFIDHPAFEAPGVPPAEKLYVDLSATLLARKFDAYALRKTELPQPGRPWLIKAYVEADAHGTVIHAILETPAASADLNAAVLRALFRCVAIDAGAPCGGNVIISGTGKKPTLETRETTQ